MANGQTSNTFRWSAANLLLVLLVGLSGELTRPTQAQDLLRNNLQRGRLGQQQQQPQPNPLANIQLPPQLASLTPAQLHQLAQLREMQIQQQQQQQANQANQANQAEPANAEVAPTAQPAAAGPARTQIPRPALGGQPAEGGERHDDGAYNESGSEMEGVAAAGDEPAGPSGANQTAAAPSFEVNWNKCPQLEPSESEKGKKTQVITKCLQSAPIPTNLTRENVESHREQIATCALKVEGWFDDQGNYRYEKAEAEIRAKRLESAIELQVLKFHVACRDEASKKFPRDQNKLIDQVQFYQACMDYYISIVCEIEVSVDQ